MGERDIMEILFNSMSPAAPGVKTRDIRKASLVS